MKKVCKACNLLIAQQETYVKVKFEGEKLRIHIGCYRNWAAKRQGARLHPRLVRGE